MKWGSTALTVMILAVWIASAWVTVVWFHPRVHAGLVQGSGLIGGPVPGRPMGFSSEVHSYSFRWWNWWWDSNSRLYTWRLLFPFWILGVPPLLTAAITWRLDRGGRKRPGSCGKCGYDRVGLAADAVCPECGEASTVRR